MHRPRKRLDPQKYPLFARIAIKVAQLILGAAILGLVLGPMRGSSFHDFAIRTNTEWQGKNLVSIITIALLVDAHITLIGILAYLVASCLEAYYAACYPPNGAKINLVCHRAEWIIACVGKFYSLISFSYMLSFYFLFSFIIIVKVIKSHLYFSFFKILIGYGIHFQILCFINTALYVIDFVMSWISGVTML
uniref:G_PROTEIN_RECEP_F1_2 domain-containing protein n=1 Tax=Heterorhabditis bacteriophora TaxID=37862 RepID=A0A1I7WL66_HETBA